MTQMTDDILYGRSALKLGEPWIVPESLDMLKEIIDPSWLVFEWGAGGSTVFWSKRCTGVVSIEHNSEWVERVQQMIEKHQCPNNIDLRYVRGHGTDHRTAFRDYADAILSFPDETFDLVFVDGEASSRGWCLRNAIPKLKPGGYLLLDNSDWLKDPPEGWERTDYVARDLKWIGQAGTFNWWTSIMRKST
jgi:predicted O-methyltransferase YrrM